MTALPNGSGALRHILEQACAETKCPAGTLTVLAVQNDPFRVDTSARHRDGQWLAINADRLGLGERRIHLRGLHYMLVSGVVAKPNGEPYRNNEEDWIWLINHASKAARWLGYVPFDQVIDARNTAPVIREHKRCDPAAHISVGIEVTVPDAHEINPSVWATGIEPVQPFHLVFYGEKTSLEDVLGPIAERVGADLYLPAGELTDSQLHQMAKIGAGDGRPMVVLCFCDCDPSGWQMPISIGRKLQAFKAFQFPDLTFQVRRVALMPEHVRLYGLPSTPLKETERRGDKWKAAMSVEQTEIDALAALRPELLQQLAEQALVPFFDYTLFRRCVQARRDWEDACQAAIDAQTDQDQLDRLRTEAEQTLATLQAEVDRLNRELSIDPTGYELPAPSIPEPEITAEPDGLPLVEFGLAMGGAVAPADRVEGLRRGGRGRAMNARDIARYVLELTPIAHGATPAAPCRCGDTVFYRLQVDGPWLCRNCRPPGAAGWRTVRCVHEPRCDPPEHQRSAVVRWFVAPEIGR